MEPNNVHDNSTDAIRLTVGLSLLASIWFFVSPWVYGAYLMPSAWNSWVVGAVMGIAAIVGLNLRARDAANLAWLSIILSIWTFFSPWIYGYSTNTGRLINNLCVGVVIFVLSVITAATATRTTSTTVAHRM